MGLSFPLLGFLIIMCRKVFWVVLTLICTAGMIWNVAIQKCYPGLTLDQVWAAEPIQMGISGFLFLGSLAVGVMVVILEENERGK